MGFMPDSLNGSDPSKSAFLEFGHGHPAHQQHPQGLSHIYPVHGLHAPGHSQHESPFTGNASYGRSLGYAYPGAVNAHPPSAYMSYQHSNLNGSGTNLVNSRLETTGMWGKKITREVVAAELWLCAITHQARIFFDRKWLILRLKDVKHEFSSMLSVN